MKRIIRLTESDLIDVIRQVINESLTVSPYTLSVTEKGNVEILNTSTNKSHIYKIKSNQWPLGYVTVTVKSLNKNGMTASYAGIEETIPIKVDKIKNLITTNFGKSEIIFKEDDTDAKFVKVS